MCRSIRNNYANSLIDNNIEHIHFNKFPGAHARQIKHYAKWSIENGEADSIVINAGTNDIEPSVEKISKWVLDIERQAKQMGVANIYVCGLIYRKQRLFDHIIRDINLAIRLVSSAEGFIYISNDNINRSDLHGDGLHLNPEGTEKLLENILSNTCPSF